MVQQRSDLCMRPSNLRMHSRDRHHGNPTRIAKKQRKIAPITAGTQFNDTSRSAFEWKWREQITMAPSERHRTFMRHEFPTFIVSCEIPLQRSFKASRWHLLWGHLFMTFVLYVITQNTSSFIDRTCS